MDVSKHTHPHPHHNQTHHDHHPTPQNHSHHHHLPSQCLMTSKLLYLTKQAEC